MQEQQQSEIHPFQMMAKPIGPLCDLDCTYCYYLEKEKLYPKERDWKMPLDVLDSFIRQQIETQQSANVSFAWQGGEPTLLGVKYFVKVVELQQKYAEGRTIENALQTNGMLLDDEWCSFLAKNQFLVGISIDGPRELHDRYRLNRRSGGTFDRVLHGLELLKKHHVEFNTLAVVHRHNSRYPLEVYRFLKEIGSRFMQFIPIVERSSAGRSTDGLQLVPPHFSPDANVTEWSVEPMQYGTFLCSIFDEWIRRDVGKFFVQLFDVALQSWIGMEQSLCAFRETCGDALALEHNGDLYSCDHYVYPEYKLGNIIDNPIETLVSSARQQKFGKDKLDSLPKYCRDCEVQFACNGECPKHRFIKTPGGEDGLNYLCAGYKKFFQHIDPAMRFMASELRNERPPANVMQWMREQDSGRRGRNDPCSCGSGKKYKHCHGT